MSKSYTIVLKLGSSSLVDSETKEPKLSTMTKLVETVSALKRLGHKVVIVSSGGIAMGLNVMNLDKRPTDVSSVQALAAIGQGRLIGKWDLLFQEYEEEIAQILLTRNDILHWKQFSNARNTILELLKMGVTPIVNENDTLSISEIEFGDNDTLSGVTSALIQADFLFLMTDVDCLYTSNPRTDPLAKPILTVKNLNLSQGENSNPLKGVNVSGEGSSVGTGGMKTKIIAADLATNAGVHTVIMKSEDPINIIRIIKYLETYLPKMKVNDYSNEEELRKLEEMDVPLHTKFIASDDDKKLEDRQFWLLHGLVSKGSIIIDKTVYETLLDEENSQSDSNVNSGSEDNNNNSDSLFHRNISAMSVIGIENKFHELECVNLKIGKRLSNGELDPDYPVKTIGRARVNYTSAEFERIKDFKDEKEFESLLGRHNNTSSNFYIASEENLAFEPL